MKTISSPVIMFFLLIINPLSMFSQQSEDIIVFKNSDTVKCKVIFIHDNYLVYREQDKTDYERNKADLINVEKIILSPSSELNRQSFPGLEEKVHFLSKKESGPMDLRKDTTEEVIKKIPVESQLTYLNGNIMDYQGNVLDNSQIQFYMKNSPQALSKMQSARQSQITALAFYSLGVATGIPCIVIGKISLETENYDNEKLFYSLAGACVLSTVVAMIVDADYKKKAQLAVKLFNESGKHSSANSTVLKMGLVQGGLGIAIQL